MAAAYTFLDCMLNVHLSVTDEVYCFKAPVALQISRNCSSFTSRPELQTLVVGSCMGNTTDGNSSSVDGNGIVKKIW